MTTTYLKAFVLLLVSAFLSSCASNKPQGPDFQKYLSRREGRALVYVYRPLGERLGWNRTYYLHNKNGRITELKHGGYFPFQVEPGEVVLVATLNRTLRTNLPLLSYVIEKASGSDTVTVKFEAEDGKTYYVVFRPIAHFTYFEPTLTLVDESSARGEILKTKLLVNE